MTTPTSSSPRVLFDSSSVWFRLAQVLTPYTASRDTDGWFIHDRHGLTVSGPWPTKPGMHLAHLNKAVADGVAFGMYGRTAVAAYTHILTQCGLLDTGPAETAATLLVDRNGAHFPDGAAAVYALLDMMKTPSGLADLTGIVTVAHRLG